LVKATPADVGSSEAEAEAAQLSPALEDVVRRFGNSMGRTAHRHNLAPSELDDVVQEARIRLWKALGSADNIRQAPALYIHRTTMSAALDFLRRRRSRREESLNTLADTASWTPASSRQADDTLRENETRRAVTRAVDLLVESRRAVVRTYLAGYEREEIAELLGWSEAKTRNLLYRGLAEVREPLESWGYGPGARE
jgi:RNA polymerase sigma-70 factor (ECF subfamily)